MKDQGHPSFLADTTTYSNLGYPYAAEPCEHSPYTVTGGANYCSNYDFGPTRDTTPGWTESDSYDPNYGNYGYRNCNDYVAWQLAQYGVPAADYTGLGNGGDWYTNANNKGLSVGTTPEVGAAAIKPSTWSNGVETDPGHVAYVRSVTYNADGTVNPNGNITVWEYNHDEAGDGDTWTGPPSDRGFTEYVYFAKYMANPPSYISGVGSPGTTYPPSPLYQFSNSGSSWGQSDLTYTDPNGTAYYIEGTPSVIWGSTINVFAIGSSGQLLEYSLPSGGTQWFPYTVENNTALAGGVSAVQVGSTIEVFATGANGHLYQFSNPGSGWSQNDLTYTDPNTGTVYTVEGAPSVIWGSTINVFVAGTNGNLLQYSLPPGGTQWFPYTDEDTTALNGGVSAIQVGSSLDVFATGTNGHLYEVSNPGSGWQTADCTYTDGTTLYTIQGGPSAVMTGSTLNVFAVGFNGELFQYSIQGGSWFPYTIDSATLLSGGVSAVLEGSTLEVFGD